MPTTEDLQGNIDSVLCQFIKCFYFQAGAFIWLFRDTECFLCLLPFAFLFTFYLLYLLNYFNCFVFQWRIFLCCKCYVIFC